MYTVNSGIELDTINDLIYHLNNIVSEYGDLPIYIEDNSPGRRQNSYKMYHN